jgi:hypothetical protein
MSKLTIDKVEDLEQRIAKLEQRYERMTRTLDVYGVVLEELNNIDLEQAEADATLAFLASQVDKNA